MNLLARILSHGFALALVALIAISLMYRGVLFPEWGLPEFLVIDDKSGTGQAETLADESRPQAEAVATIPEPVVEETTEEITEKPPTIIVPMGNLTDSRVASEPAADSPVTPAADQAIDDSVQETVVVSDVEVDEPLDVGQAESGSESGSGDQAGFNNEAIDSGVVGSSAAVVEAVPPQIDPVAKPAIVTAGSPDKLPVQEETEQLTPLAEENASQLAPESEPADTADTADTADPEPGPLAITPESVPATQSEPSQSALSTPPSPFSDSDSPTATVDSSSEKTAYELLAAAREAYWLRDYEGAEVFYRQLIVVEPNNPDGYGELGNMYFSQGQWKQAAAAYYEAGVRMINEGRAEQARQLVDVIRGLNGGQADELERQVDAARQNTP